MVIGHVAAIHIDGACIVNDRFDTARAQPVARVGYRDYAVVTQAFEIKRSNWPLAPKSESAETS